MNIADIRPLSTYIGNGGVTRKVKSISMAIDGSLTVEWRRVPPLDGVSRYSEPRGNEPIEQFAMWAKVLKDTLSSDLEHHMFDHDLYAGQEGAQACSSV
ncbi:hypothetical protein [Herbaspirillum sp. 1130]|uniref:hypothetical protein n=1 Tax=Herbaspirillum sp. 1130 TaxID=2806562 RepID=UPI001AE8B320|nr:hypothetical protein [Herbaspirillum sp. 1130]MBP1316301.1 hypothetical protein [Herbaspirillum sp. 1130]